jgi:catechol 2,3-dioxygenase-like lactoylglutathione lyase family enzyme
MAALALIVVVVTANSVAQSASDPNESRGILIETTAPVLWQPSMNVFRRFSVAPEKMYDFYGSVLGFKQLATLNVDGTGGVARFQAGAQELKLTRRVESRKYVQGGVTEATGLRLLTFFFDDETALVRRFDDHGYAAPTFALVTGSSRRSALVTDPDGQAVELVVLPQPRVDELQAIEVGLTVEDVDRSRAFYGSFVGLEELPPVLDDRFGTTKYSFRHGATTITLRSFGRPLPADTGSGGIQYVVSDVDAVAALAAERRITIEQPLSGLPNFALRAIWLDDPDGITNYFAETAQSRAARKSAAAQP